LPDRVRSTVHGVILSLHTPATPWRVTQRAIRAYSQTRRNNEEKEDRFIPSSAGEASTTCCQAAPAQTTLHVERGTRPRAVALWRPLYYTSPRNHKKKGPFAMQPRRTQTHRRLLRHLQHPDVCSDGTLQSLLLHPQRPPSFRTCGRQTGTVRPAAVAKRLLVRFDMAHGPGVMDPWVLH
jgi:hypothetical protein